MVEITRTRDHDPYGDVEYLVEWADNDGVGRERYFKSRREAERFALEIETTLLNEAVQDFNNAYSAMSPTEASKLRKTLVSRA